MNSETLQYRAAAVQSATPVQLVCMLYDTVVRDLGRALDAIKSNNVETRSAEIKHALLVLDQLDAFLDEHSGGEAAANLSRFYAVARSRIVEGHAKVDGALFREQIRLFQEVRSAWEKVDPSRSVRTDDNLPSGPEKAATSSGLSCSA
jgi:flagellar secretion chaperone FliS